LKKVLLLALLVAACSRKKPGHVLFGTPAGGTPGADVVVDRGGYLEGGDPGGKGPHWLAWKVGARVPRTFAVSEELESAEKKAPDPTYVIAGVTPEGAIWQVVARPDGDAVKAFAVMVPPDAPRPVKWQEYVRKIDEVERASGYDLFPALPGGVQARLESARNDPADVLRN
jgi:hypothetical protein